MQDDRFRNLTDRQRDYLRQVFQHRNSQEIAFALGVSARAVDKQLQIANLAASFDARPTRGSEPSVIAKVRPTRDVM